MEGVSPLEGVSASSGGASASLSGASALSGGKMNSPGEFNILTSETEIFIDGVEESQEVEGSWLRFVLFFSRNTRIYALSHPNFISKMLYLFLAVFCL